jgi:hypothetical protein
MSSAAESHFRDRLAQATIELDPFPHCVIDQVFPEDFFFDLQEHWPDEGVLTPLADTGRVYGMRERLALVLDAAGLAKLRDPDRQFWREQVLAWLMSPAACRAMAAKFDAITAPRLHAAGGRLWGDALIVSDRENYAIGPHTDAPHRLVSALFYLPVDEWTFADRVGTVLYRPRDPRMTCAGGPHYGYEAFQAVRRVAFLPNRMLLFPKTTTSFHGVERVAIPGIDRRLLIFNVRIPV